MASPEQPAAAKAGAWFAQRVSVGLHLKSAKSMKAVILAAGKGTRMGELTNDLPKPMLKVQGQPILEHILRGVLATGIRDIFIVTGFQAEAIESSLETVPSGARASSLGVSWCRMAPAKRRGWPKRSLAPRHSY